VSSPLSANPGHVDLLCRRLQIGEPRGALASVAGGFHHRMWRLVTTRGVYAVKQLAPDTDLADRAALCRFDTAESIAEAFAGRGVATVFALRCGGGYLQRLPGAAYLVYPWCDAVALGKHRVSERHALEVAGVLAKMHRADLDVPGLASTAPDTHSGEELVELVRYAAQRNLPSAGALRAHLPILVGILEKYATAQCILEEQLVVSHGDLDQKNVLWDRAGRPVLIDWESARRLNPTYEVLLEALDWSGISSRFDGGLFEKVIAAYRAAGGRVEGRHLQAALDAIAGDWLDWLMYNLGRVVNLEEAEQRRMGAEQADFVLPVVLRMNRLAPDLLAAARLSVRAGHAAPARRHV
jgi:aminoglycoside phosphotransferase (APT) family kinase protein